MDGPSLINFTVAAVPQLVENILASASLSDRDIDLYLFHQATRKMLDQLRERMGVTQERLPMELKHVATPSAPRSRSSSTRSAVMAG
jgi:3-oxoacyl-[acyl-carrier-protein] synthase-3